MTIKNKRIRRHDGDPIFFSMIIGIIGLACFGPIGAILGFIFGYIIGKTRKDKYNAAFRGTLGKVRKTARRKSV